MFVISNLSLFCGEIIFLDCVVYHLPLIISMVACYEYFPMFLRAYDEFCNDYHIICVGILSSFYLYCCSMMVICERRLHITSPIRAHRAAPLCNGMGRTSGDSYFSLIHEVALGEIYIGDPRV
jgi:hypothetical protein